MCPRAPEPTAEYIAKNPDSLLARSHRQTEETRKAAVALTRIRDTEPHPQSQSSLFSVLPAEVRLRIYEYTLMPHPDLDKPYDHTRFYYRPGFFHQSKTAIGLLQVCRKVYLEARDIPLTLCTFAFWLFRGPIATPVDFKRSYVWDFERYFKNWMIFTLEQKAQIRCIQLHTQQFALEGMGHTERTPRLSALYPLLPNLRELRITFRHSDWWNWETSNDPGICPWRSGRTSYQDMLAQPANPDLDFIKQHMVKRTWGHQITTLSSLRRLVLEFEHVAEKNAQMDKVVERAQNWMFPIFIDEHREVPVAPYTNSTIITTDPPRRDLATLEKLDRSLFAPHLLRLKAWNTTRRQARVLQCVNGSKLNTFTWSNKPGHREEHYFPREKRVIVSPPPDTKDMPDLQYRVVNLVFESKD